MNRETKLQRALYQVGRGFVGACARLRLDLDVVWHAPLPQGAKIICANHPSTTDPFLLPLLVPEHTTILIGGALFEVPVFGRYLRAAGHVPVLDGRGYSALIAARRRLEAGRTVAIFPEGALSQESGSFLTPHLGAASLALSMGVPIVPVGIALDRTRLRLVETNLKGRSEVAHWYLNGPYAMTVGEPLRFHGHLADRERVTAATDLVMRQIAGLSEESKWRLGAASNRPGGSRAV